MWPIPSIASGLLIDTCDVGAAYVSWCARQNGLATLDLYTCGAPLFEPVPSDGQGSEKRLPSLAEARERAVAARGERPER